MMRSRARYLKTWHNPQNRKYVILLAPAIVWNKTQPTNTPQQGR